MNKYKNKAMFSTLNTYSKDELISFINENKQLANTRLASLERYGNDNTSAYRYIRKKAFTSNQGIQATDGKTRFIKATTKQTRNQLLAEAQNLAGFLASRTSTKKGRDEIFAETVNKINKNNNIKLTIKQAEDIFNSEVFQSYREQMNLSNTVLQIFSDYLNTKKGWNVQKIEQVLSDYFDSKSQLGESVSEVGLRNYINNILELEKKELKHNE